jgi:hypothetical protein
MQEKPTDRVEQDPELHDNDANNVDGQARRLGRLDLALDDALANVLDEKRDEQAGHGDGARRGPVRQLAHALAAESLAGLDQKLRASVGQ